MNKSHYIIGLSVGLLSLSLMGCQQDTITTTAPTPNPTATQAAQNTEAILATSPDKNFVLKGEGTCNGSYTISADLKSKITTRKSYNLGYSKDASYPEAQDLGSVIVQTLKQYATNKPDPKVEPLAFKNDQIIVSGIITNANITDENCKIIIAEYAATQTNSSELKINGLTFTFPAGWSLQKMETESNKGITWDVAKIKVPDAKYNVAIPFQILNSDYKIAKDDVLLKTTTTGAKIYQSGCAPAIACYFMTYNGKTYNATFQEPESNQPEPANLDGVWFPDTTVTNKETLNFLATVK